MPPHLLGPSPLSKAGLAEPRANNYNGWGGSWPQAPERQVDPVMVVMIVLYVGK